MLRRSLLALSAAAAALAAFLAGAPAAAAPPANGGATATPIGTQAANEEMNKPHVRRSGVVIGFDLGVGLAEASGYPNDVNYLGNADYYSASSLMLGTAGSLFVMGALTDYLNFGFWFGSLRGTNKDWRASGNGVGFRVEAFPLFGIFPALQDLGVMGRFGIGGGSLDVKLPGNYPDSSGSQSYAGVGVFHEWRLFSMLHGHVSIAPTLDYDAIFTRSIEMHGMTIGGRLVFYGGT